jgi:hypothetical protein
MPKIEQTIADVNVRSHTMRFISPGVSERLKVPSPCTSCHTDKANQWAIDVMKTWTSVSPWRIGPL